MTIELLLSFHASNIVVDSGERADLSNSLWPSRVIIYHFTGTLCRLANNVKVIYVESWVIYLSQKRENASEGLSFGPMNLY